MTKRLTLSTLFALACVLFAAVTLLICLFPATASADGTTYAVAAIEFDKAAYVGSDYMDNVKASVWTSNNNADWQLSTLAALDAELLYYEGDTLLGAVAPTVKGTYTAKVVLGANCPVNLQNTDEEAIGPNSVLVSLSYRVVEKNVSIVFAPSSDIDYDGQDHKTDILGNTKVYKDGEDVTATAAVDVQDGTHAVTASVQDPGEYHVVVTYEEKTYTSTFYVRRAISGIISLRETVMYEGMYTSYDINLVNQAANNTAEATMLAKRTAYYVPKFVGGLADVNGAIADEYADKVTISYWQGSNRLAQAPTRAGTYTCRVCVSNAIGKYDLKEGDFVDLSYTIKPTPYQVVWNKPINASLDGMYLVHNPMAGLSVRVSQFVLTADSGRNVDLHLVENESHEAIAIYYRDCVIDNEHMLTAQQIADGIKELGRYTVLYRIDYQYQGASSITGAKYFENDNASFVINADNCWVKCDFEVIGAYELENVRSV